ncbi:MAG: hypothetical protein QOJ07_1046 [Thermoleophilaceae bacterium]|jgi:hypothetical protein|nr:hypothetical protein [Thermoleophilaceae bacterium]
MSWLEGDTPPAGFAAVERDDPPVPTKVCPKCSTQERTQGKFCPHCGASYEKRPRFSRRKKIGAMVLVGLLLVAGAGTGVIAKLHHDDVVDKRHRKEAAAKAERRRQAEINRQIAADDAQQKRDAEDLQRTERTHLVSQLEKSITKDARKRVIDSSGIIEGPILRTQCEPSAGTDTGDLSVTTGEYRCLAVNKENTDGTASGYRFTANVNFDDFSYTWQLGG